MFYFFLMFLWNNHYIKIQCKDGAQNITTMYMKNTCNNLTEQYTVYSIFSVDKITLIEGHANCRHI
jgi:hypothetical protein